MELIGRILFAGGVGSLVTLLVVVTVVGMIASQFVPFRFVQRMEEAVATAPLAVHALVLAVGLLVVDALGPTGVAPFIYFQF